MKPKATKTISAISLFSGSGGMDLGFAVEGFDIRAAVELDPAACATLRKNWPGHAERLIEKPLEKVTTRQLLRTAGVKKGELGILIGGPPCQSWCVAGNRMGFDDPRGLALLEFCRVVRDAQPVAFCIENVPGLLTHKGTNVLAVIEHQVNRGPGERYQLVAETLDAAEYGVPQRRRRVFIIGNRYGIDFRFPEPTHFIGTAQKRPWKRPAVTVSQALAGLPEPTPPSAQARRVARTIAKRNEKWYGKR